MRTTMCSNLLYGSVCQFSQREACREWAAWGFVLITMLSALLCRRLDTNIWEENTLLLHGTNLQRPQIAGKKPNVDTGPLLECRLRSSTMAEHLHLLVGCGFRAPASLRSPLSWHFLGNPLWYSEKFLRRWQRTITDQPKTGVNLTKAFDSTNSLAITINL